MISAVVNSVKDISVGEVALPMTVGAATGGAVGYVAGMGAGLALLFPFMILDAIFGGSKKREEQGKDKTIDELSELSVSGAVYGAAIGGTAGAVYAVAHKILLG